MERTSSKLGRCCVQCLVSRVPLWLWFPLHGLWIKNPLHGTPDFLSINFFNLTLALSSQRFSVDFWGFATSECARLFSHAQSPSLLFSHTHCLIPLWLWFPLHGLRFRNPLHGTLDSDFLSIKFFNLMLAFLSRRFSVDFWEFAFGGCARHGPRICLPWEIKFRSQWRSGLGFNFVSSSSVIWVSVPVVVGVKNGGAVEIRLGLRLNWLGWIS